MSDQHAAAAAEVMNLCESDDEDAPVAILINGPPATAEAPIVYDYNHMKEKQFADDVNNLAYVVYDRLRGVLQTEGKIQPEDWAPLLLAVFLASVRTSGLVNSAISNAAAAESEKAVHSRFGSV
jgi:hypothetical protein